MDCFEVSIRVVDKYYFMEMVQEKCYDFIINKMDHGCNCNECSVYYNMRHLIQL
jgi:hypothetical protein